MEVQEYFEQQVFLSAEEKLLENLRVVEGVLFRLALPQLLSGLHLLNQADLCVLLFRVCEHVKGTGLELVKNRVSLGPIDRRAKGPSKLVDDPGTTLCVQTHEGKPQRK